MESGAFWRCFFKHFKVLHSHWKGGGNVNKIVDVKGKRKHTPRNFWKWMLWNQICDILEEIFFHIYIFFTHLKYFYTFQSMPTPPKNVFKDCSEIESGAFLRYFLYTFQRNFIDRNFRQRKGYLIVFYSRTAKWWTTTWGGGGIWPTRTLQKNSGQGYLSSNSHPPKHTPGNNQLGMLQ